MPDRAVVTPANGQAASAKGQAGMDLGFTGRVAIITGAEGGMGLATATLLAAEGVKLVLTDKLIAELETEARTLPGDVLTLAADMTDRPSVDAVAAAALERFGCRADRANPGFRAFPGADPELR